MTKDRSAFKAGLFILCSIALAIGVIISIKGLSSFFDKRVEHQVTFTLTDDLGGLRPGDSVRVGGFPVGEVRKIQALNVDANSKDEPKLLLTFNLPQRYVLREDARMAMQSTLTGTANLNIEALGSGKVAPDDHIFVGQRNPISAIFSSFGEIAPDLKAISGDVRNKLVPQITTAASDATTLLKDANDVVRTFKTKADPIADRSLDMITQIRDFFGESKADWRGTVANLRATTASMRERIPTILQGAEATITKAKDSMDDVKATLANTKDVTANVKLILQRNNTRIDSIVAGLKTSSDNIKGATAELRRAPWRLLYKPSRDEINNLVLFDATRQFAEGANDLSDASGALRDAMQNPNLDPATAQKLVDELQRSFDKFKDVEGKLWKEAK